MEHTRDAAGSVLAIERRTASLRARLRLAVSALLSKDESTVRVDPDPEDPASGDLEQYALHWSGLVPLDAEVRAEVAFRLASKYDLQFASTPRLQAALHLDDEDVRDAFLRLYGRPLETIWIVGESPAAPADSLERDLEWEFEWIVLPGGETLFRQGEPGDSLYILVSGRLAVMIPDPSGGDRLVAEIGPGETVGEMAVLTGEGRSATVQALRDAELVRLTKAGFDRLLEKHPRALMQIAALMVIRLKRANTGEGRRVPLATIAVVSAGRGGGCTPEFPMRLAAALSACGSTLRLNSRYVDENFRPGLARGAAQAPLGGPESDMLSTWVSNLESKYRYIIYESDNGLTSWTRRCLRQADRVLLVAAADADPEWNEIERELYSAPGRLAVRHELVLLRRDGDEPLPGRASTWLAQRRVALHHHTGERDEAGYARLARFLTGRAIGLALSGGGARGFVHVGTIRALRQAGVPVDVVAGTSIGSIIGALCALERDVPSMLETLRHGFVRMRPMTDYTIPLVSMLRGGRMVRMLTTIFGNRQIEDLPLKYFCVSSNLTTGQAMTHEQGLLWKYLRASCSVPGLLPPVWDHGSLLVDGGLLNNLPADELCRFCDAAFVVAVNCNPQAALASSGEFGDSLSFSQVLWRRINPRRESLGVPNIRQILERTTMLASIGTAAAYEHGEGVRAEGRAVGLYLHPPTDEYSFLEVDQMENIAGQGFRYGLPRIEAWKKTMEI